MDSKAVITDVLKSFREIPVDCILSVSSQGDGSLELKGQQWSDGPLDA